MRKHLESTMRVSLCQLVRFWNLPDLLSSHSKLLVKHRHAYFAHKANKQRNIYADNIVAVSAIGIGDSIHNRIPVEDKVVVLMLIQNSLDNWEMLNRNVASPVGFSEIESLLPDEGISSSLCRSVSYLWQTDQGRTSWLATIASLKHKPVSCIAVALAVLLHFEMSKFEMSSQLQQEYQQAPTEEHARGGYKPESLALLIQSIVAVLRKMQPHVIAEKDLAMHGQCNGVNRNDKNSFPLSSTPATRLHEPDVAAILFQIMHLSAMLAHAANWNGRVDTLPDLTRSIMSCMILYRQRDVVNLASKMSDLTMSSSSSDFALELKDPLVGLAEDLFEPCFRLFSTKEMRGRMPEGGDLYFQVLFQITCLLLDLVSMPTGKIMSSATAVANMIAAASLAQTYLKLLAYFRERTNASAQAAGSGKVKCRMEYLSMVYDYILFKLIRLMKAFKLGTHTSAMIDRADSAQERDVCFSTLKDFVEAAIDVFSTRSLDSPSPSVASRAKGSPKKRVLGAPKVSSASVSARAKNGGKRRRRTTRCSSNAFIDAAIRGEGYKEDEDGDLSDLEDFIVCKPGRNYDKVLAKRSPPSSASKSAQTKGKLTSASKRSEPRAHQSAKPLPSDVRGQLEYWRMEGPPKHEDSTSDSPIRPSGNPEEEEYDDEDEDPIEND